MYSITTVSMLQAIYVFATLGIVLSLTYLYRLAKFIWIYCIRPSSIHKYLHGAAPYALVTGASDGIGKALANELYEKGFNLILHGRNEEKLKRVVEEICNRPVAKRDVKYFVVDAGNPEKDVGKVLEEFKGLNVTLVVHNAGASLRKPRQLLDDWAEEEVLYVVRLNAIFPLLLTRVLLPQLRATKGPTLVVFVGSLSADFPVTSFGIYAASKNFTQALSRCLAADERWLMPSSNSPSFMYLPVGEVVSSAMPYTTNLFRPSSEQFAKAVVARIGCGWERIAPWMPHAILQWGMALLGRRMMERAGAKRVADILNDSEMKKNK